MITPDPPRRGDTIRRTTSSATGTVVSVMRKTVAVRWEASTSEESDILPISSVVVVKRKEAI